MKWTAYVGWMASNRSWVEVEGKAGAEADDDWGWGWGWRCPFTGRVVTHSQGHGRGRGWIIMTLQQFQHATCGRELRRRATLTATATATVPKWQCNMIALGLATCHIYHSSKRWKISHSFILHPNAESCLPAAQKPVRRPEQILLALLATTCHILGDQSDRARRQFPSLLLLLLLLSIVSLQQHANDSFNFYEFLWLRKLLLGFWPQQRGTLKVGCCRGC